MLRTFSPIQREWQMSPLKNPAMSTVRRDMAKRDTKIIRVNEIEEEANAFLRDGNFEDAISKSNEGIAMLNQCFGSEHPEHIYLNILLGEAYMHCGNYGAAATALNTANRILEQSPGFTETHIWRVTCDQDLGTLHRVQGNLAESERLFRKVVEVRRSTQGASHPDTAFAYLQGRYDRALNLLQKARSTFETYYGSDSVQVASAINHTGSIYLRQGRMHEALEAYTQGQALLEARGLYQNPDLATVCCNLGIVHEHLEQYDQALDCYERARAMRERILGSGHPDTASCVLHIGRLMLAMGRLAGRAHHPREHACTRTAQSSTW
ncbi:putative tetratricopeptide repeat protein [Paratrimastix pyriformis]|uniref:Tetratricopeptide repeat protein n=1 Tax=Paratrimastix pyriformis TaxID=342808 RepID=A0ABQ8UJU3_9EUKA|nr:putative tetratricopeptide repeat protein [Paratrimastix pyriformis]